jgi:hypothetical protein
MLRCTETTVNATMVTCIQNTGIPARWIALRDVKSVQPRVIQKHVPSARQIRKCGLRSSMSRDFPSLTTTQMSGTFAMSSAPVASQKMRMGPDARVALEGKQWISLIAVRFRRIGMVV